MFGSLYQKIQKYTIFGISQRMDHFLNRNFPGCFFPYYSARLTRKWNMAAGQTATISVVFSTLDLSASSVQSKKGKKKRQNSSRLAAVLPLGVGVGKILAQHIVLDGHAVHFGLFLMSEAGSQLHRHLAFYGFQLHFAGECPPGRMLSHCKFLSPI